MARLVPVDFDPFAPGPAQDTAAAAQGGAFSLKPVDFDPFAPIPKAEGAPKDTGSGPMVVDVHPTPKTSGILVDPHDPEAAQRAWDTLTGSVQPGRGESALRGARQGVGLGFADEARGLAEASGLPSWLPGAQIVGAGRLAAENILPDALVGHSAHDRYNETVSQERASDALAQAANPGTYLTGELTGGLAGGLALPMAAPLTAAKGAGTVARVRTAAGNLAATGALYGGIAGVGGAEGDLGEQIGSGLKGAAVGAALVPAVGGAIAVPRAAARFAGKHISAMRDPSGVADEVIARALERDNINPADLPGRIQDAGTAGPQFRVSPEGMEPATASGDFNYYAPQATAQHNVATQPRTTGQPLTAADVGGIATRNQAARITRLPGPGQEPARQFLENRQIGTETQPGQGQRISDQITQQIGGKGGTLETADALIAKRSEEAKPAYERAFNTALDYSKQAGQDLLALIERIPNQAKAAANQIIKMSDEGGHQLVWRENPDINGNFELAAVPNARQWHYIKMGIDSLIDAHTDALTGKVDTLGRAATMLKNELTRALGELNPAYKGANQAFAGHSELISALRAGADAFKPGTTPEALAKAIKDLTPGEAEMYRLGAANALKERLGNMADGVNKARVAFGNPNIRAKIAALAPTPAARTAFIKALENEKAMFETRANALGNSKTAERTADDADLSHTIETGLHLAKNITHPMRLVGKVLTITARHLARVNPEMRGKVLDEVRRVVLNPDPAAVHEFVARMHARPMNDGTRRSVVGAVLNALPGAVPQNTVSP